MIMIYLRHGRGRGGEWGWGMHNLILCDERVLKKFKTKWS